jgi:lincosamide nucleotidyltransferase A/C/D/E
VSFRDHPARSGFGICTTSDTVAAMMTAGDVLRVLRALEDQGVTVWLSDGGWGVDALLGKQTRPHNDLDVIVSLDHVPTLRDVLAAQGFRLTEGQPPLCFVLADDHGHMVDVHPVAFDDQGDGHYTMAGDQIWVYPAAGFAGTGVVDGRPVRCLTAEVQVLCHAGYQLREVDFHDMQALHRRFGVQLLLEHQRPSADNR